jgi:uncharacterized protein
MPANLPPEYYELDKKLRETTDNAEKIELLERMHTVTPKHKGTDKIRADLRKRISKLKNASHSKKNLGKKESAYKIPKEGGGQVVVIGPANSGKSALLDTLTNASPEVANFPFTTWSPMPGMMRVHDIQIQLIDTPPLNSDHIEADYLDLLRRTELLLLMVDLQNGPLVQFEDSITLLEEHRIFSEQKKDQIEADMRASFVPLLVLANKYDDEEAEETFEIFEELVEGDWTMMPVSVTSGRNIDEMKLKIFEILDIIRVYSKSPGKDADMKAPFVLKRGSTVGDFAAEVHQDFAKQLKSAKMWGKAVFDGQMVQRNFVLNDEDVVELTI